MEKPKYHGTHIWLDAGHGGTENGTTSPYLGKEKDENLRNTLYMQKRFKELGFKVSMTRTTDTTVNWKTRTSNIAKSGAKLCISNHFNGFNGNAYGFETFRSIHAKRDWGYLVHKYINKVGINNDRGCKTKLYPGTNDTDYYFMHRATGHTQTLIIEYFFGDVKRDVELYKKNREAYLEAVIKATCEYCKVPYKEV